MGMTDASSACVKAIVAHEEHDTVYVKDPACRSFSYDTLKLFIEIILENMPAGAASLWHILPAPCMHALKSVELDAH